AVALLPSEGLGVVVLTNAAPMGVPETICASCFDLVLHGKVEKDWGQLFGKAFEALNQPTYGTAVDYRQPPARPFPALPPDAYVGKYRNAYYGDIDIVASDGTLHLRLGPKQTPFTLRHWDRDTFFYQPTGEMAGGLSGVAFSVGPERRARSVAIENLNIH